MTKWLIPGLCGLMLGLTLHGAWLQNPDDWRDVWGMKRSCTLKAVLWAVGLSVALMAFLCYLAVMDVDRIEPLPLHAGSILGGVAFGVLAAICGFTPGTALVGLSGRKPLQACCTAVGCLLGAWLATLIPWDAVQNLWRAPAGTLFRMTLDEPYWLEGGFFRQGCIGLALMLLGMVIPAPRVQTPLPEEETPAPVVSELPAEHETFVAVIPGEEPLVVDTAQTLEDVVEFDDELHHLPPEEEVEETDGNPEDVQLFLPTLEDSEIDEELHALSFKPERSGCESPQNGRETQKKKKIQQKNRRTSKNRCNQKRKKRKF